MPVIINNCEEQVVGISCCVSRIFLLYLRAQMQRLVSGDTLFHMLVSEMKSHFLLPKRFENKLDDSVRVFSKSLKVIIHHQDIFHKRCNTGQETISYS